MTTTAEFLTQAYKIILRGWTKGAFEQTKRGHECYCLSGAVRKAVFGSIDYPYMPLVFSTNVERAEAKAKIDAYNAALQALYRAIHPRGTRITYGFQDSIVAFNDAKATKKPMVTAALRKAIKAAA